MSDCQHRGLWQAFAEHWFEDLPNDEQLNLPARWFIATTGAATFVVAHILLSANVLDTNDAPGWLFFVICVGFSVGLGFLLAWKRKKTGPVRLYISGVALPSFVFLAARSGTFLGMPS